MDNNQVQEAMKRIQDQWDCARATLVAIENSIDFDPDIKEALNSRFIDQNQLYLAQILRRLPKPPTT